MERIVMSFLVQLPEDQFNPEAFGNGVPVGGFNMNSARAMAWISQLAYETRLPDKIERIAMLWKFDDIRILQQPAKSTLPLSSTRGVLANKGNAMIIAFAGTDPANLLNWVSDFYLGRPKADVHQGFQDAAAAVSREVDSAIEQCMKDGRTLFIAGHSLGAAIALVTADRARSEKGLNQAEVYVFGSPRVGRADFVARYNASFGHTTYRFVHGKDIVPTVPPSELGFHHVGRLLQCERGQKFASTRLSAGAESDEPSAGDDFFSGIRGRLRGLFAGPLSPTSRIDTLGLLTQLLAPSIGDHLPDRYFTAATP
jgi:triacylglycerol lipase